MKKLRNKLNLAVLKGQMALRDFLSNERGDTNFISIAIVLIIVMVIAVAFIAFKDEIMNLLNQKKNEFTNALNGSGTSSTSS